MAAAARHSGDWLHDLPLTTCGLRFDNEAVRVAVGLRLGTSLCEPHQCPCGKQVDARGAQGLSCKRSVGRSIRHQQLNDIIYRALSRASKPSLLEKPELSRTDEKRPDGLRVIPWPREMSVTWDVTVTNTIADTYLHLTSAKAGGAAENAATRKENKYVDLQETNTFDPLAFETFGPINVKGMEFLQELVRHLAAISDDNRHTSFLFQRISITLQRINAITFADTFCKNSRAAECVFRFPFVFDFHSIFNVFILLNNNSNNNNNKYILNNNNK